MKKNLALLSSVIILGSLSTSLTFAEDLPPISADTSTSVDTTTSTDATTTTSATSADYSVTSATSTDSSTDAAATSTTNSNGTTVKNFTDVPVDSPFFNAIVTLRNQGVISGYPDNTFHPDQPLNRVEALKLIFEIANIQLSSGIAEAKFSDIQTDAWYAGYLNKATFLEVVAGYPDGTFKPEKSVNLVEFLKMLEVAQKVDLSTAVLAQIPYADVAPGEWYSKYVNFAKIAGLIDVAADNKIFPADPLTRGRAAQIIEHFRNWRNSHPLTDSSSTTPTSDTSSTSGVMLAKDFALYVSEGYHFAVQYPRLWFYATIANSDTSAIRTYGFGPKDLTLNPAVVRLELLPDNQNFKTNEVYNGFAYLHEESTTGNVVLSAKIAGSSRIYRISGPFEDQSIILSMLVSLTANIDGLKSYNPSEVTTTTTTTSTDTTAAPVVDSTTPQTVSS